jgi:hypothetical protein
MKDILLLIYFIIYICNRLMGEEYIKKVSSFTKVSGMQSQSSKSGPLIFTQTKELYTLILNFRNPNIVSVRNILFDNNREQC